MTFRPTRFNITQSTRRLEIIFHLLFAQFFHVCEFGLVAILLFCDLDVGWNHAKSACAVTFFSHSQIFSLLDVKLHLVVRDTLSDGSWMRRVGRC